MSPGGVINRRIKCACCLEWTECAHSGARWLCHPCWDSLLPMPWPVKDPV